MLLELCCGTVRQASLPELIRAAAGAGFDAITVNPTLYRDAGLSDDGLRALLSEQGVRVTNVDGFGSGLPGVPVGDDILPFRSYQGRDVSRALTTLEAAFYETANTLGATTVNLVHFAGDPATPPAAIAAALAAICQRAAHHDLTILLEFLPGTGIPDLEAAAKLVETVAAPNLGIMFDARHFARSGGKVEQIARYAPLVGGLQLNDLRWETRDDPERLLPGQGELPLAEIVSIIVGARPTLPVGVEVFNASLARMSPADCARAARASLTSVLDLDTGPAA